MLTCPDPPPITLIVDPHDDLVHTRAALAAHDPAAGRITVHPTPGTDSTACLAHDILAALDKLLPPPAHHQPTEAEATWATAAAWTLAAPVTQLTLLRAHLLTPRRLNDLLALRARTGVRLALVCHRPQVPAVISQALHAERHHVAEAAALLSETAGTPPPAAEQMPHPLAGRWINLPALTTLVAVDGDIPRCRCRDAPFAEARNFHPPPLHPITQEEVARRLHRQAGYPHLAAELSTATFTAASTTQLDTVHAIDLGPGAETVTLHDPHRLRQGCLTHPVPPWARPLLLAATYLHYTAAQTTRPLFTDPLDRTDVPCLTEFAEMCKLRPPQPPHPRRRKGTLRTPPPKTIWPLSNAHYYYRFAVTEVMRGCPLPPPHHRRTSRPARW